MAQRTPGKLLIYIFEVDKITTFLPRVIFASTIPLFTLTWVRFETNEIEEICEQLRKRKTSALKLVQKVPLPIPVMFSSEKK